MIILLTVIVTLITLAALVFFKFQKPFKHHNMGITKYNQGNYEDAIQEFNIAIQKNPLNANPYLYRGYCKAALGDDYGAIQDYSLGMKRKTPSADDYLNRGALKYKLEDYDGAIEDYTQATYINESDSDAYYNRGLSNSKKGLIAAAILDWRIAADFGNRRAQDKLNEFDA
jgi:tetratricopeptide (TPR) repeat protein